MPKTSTPTLKYLAKLTAMTPKYVREQLTVAEFVDLFYNQVRASAQYKKNDTFVFGVFYISTAGYGAHLRVPTMATTITETMPDYFTGFLNHYKEAILLAYMKKCEEAGIPNASWTGGKGNESKQE